MAGMVFHEHVARTTQHNTPLHNALSAQRNSTLHITRTTQLYTTHVEQVATAATALNRSLCNRAAKLDGRASSWTGSRSLRATSLSCSSDSSNRPCRRACRLSSTLTFSQPSWRRWGVDRGGARFLGQAHNARCRNMHLRVIITSSSLGLFLLLFLLLLFLLLGLFPLVPCVVVELRV